MAKGPPRRGQRVPKRMNKTGASLAVKGVKKKKPEFTYYSIIIGEMMVGERKLGPKGI